MGSMPPSGLSIRQMEPRDLPAAIALASAQGWRDRTGFFEIVFRTPTCRSLVGEMGDQLVATGVATANGPVGWLGGIVVVQSWRRRGFGRALTLALIAGLRAAGCRTISLEATDEGRPMYEAMGFRLATRYHQLQGAHSPAAPLLPRGATARPLEPADLPSIVELDRAATGEDRRAPLRTLLGLRGGWLLERGGRTAGFLLPSERAYGAVVAPRPEDGLYLLELHRSLVPPGGHVRAGIPDEHPAAWQELVGRGWHETWLAPRMLLGPDVGWRPKWIWGQINSAMG
jgi:GNAT superfamily N-acetyltransferase